MTEGVEQSTYEPMTPHGLKFRIVYSVDAEEESAWALATHIRGGLWQWQEGDEFGRTDQDDTVGEDQVLYWLHEALLEGATVTAVPQDGG